jgi:hypothetical protein
MPRKSIATSTTALPLPLGIIPSDLGYPKTGDLDYAAGDHGRITLYEVDGRRGRYWVVCTLGIRRGQRSGQADRTYGVTVDGSPVRVGIGPHVKQQITVWVRKNRRESLSKLLELHNQGLVVANQIRDRISSRRAEGQLRRADGQRSWDWSF